MGVTGEGVRCIVAESEESLRTSWGVGGEERIGVDVKLDVRECANDVGWRAGPSNEHSFRSEIRAPELLRPSISTKPQNRPAKVLDAVWPTLLLFGGLLSRVLPGLDANLLSDLATRQEISEAGSAGSERGGVWLAFQSRGCLWEWSGVQQKNGTEASFF
jgi:hypothetical protein